MKSIVMQAGGVLATRTNQLGGGRAEKKPASARLHRYACARAQSGWRQDHVYEVDNKKAKAAAGMLDATSSAPATLRR